MTDDQSRADTGPSIYSSCSRKTKGLADHIAKIDFLNKLERFPIRLIGNHSSLLFGRATFSNDSIWSDVALGARKLDLGLSTGMLKAHARSMLYRKPATLKRMRSEHKVLEIACFLRLQLLRLTDDGLGMIDYRIANLWRQARTRAEATMEDGLRRHQTLVLQCRSSRTRPRASSPLMFRDTAIGSWAEDHQPPVSGTQYKKPPQ